MLVACRARGFGAARILEPTCGSGAFLRAAADAFPHATQLMGVEYQRVRYAGALDELVHAEQRLTIHYANAYRIDFAALPWRTNGPLLVVGNPPWVTAAALGRASGDVVQPPRSNLKGLRGLAARTGAANFDVAEFLLLKLLRELGSAPVQMALLVKESVARNVLAAAARLDLGVTAAEIVRIDARAWFGVAVDACCLLVSAMPDGKLREPVSIRTSFTKAPVATFVPPTPGLPRVHGSVVFRQGIKHDAADVFELRRSAGRWRNGYDEKVEVEAHYLYPFRKARALHSGEVEPTALIVPHQRLGASTDELETHAPRLWRYLLRHAERIAARKSSIYRSAPRFAMFGIGAYSFSAWKVAVAALYAQPRFRLIGPQAGRPVLLGDTAYFAAFPTEDDARAFSMLCESPALAAVLQERIVRGKRPITKALLDTVDWASIAATLDPVPERLHALLREVPPA